MNSLQERCRLGTELVQLVFQLPETVALVVAQGGAQVTGRVVAKLLVGAPQRVGQQGVSPFGLLGMAHACFFVAAFQAQVDGVDVLLKAGNRTGDAGGGHRVADLGSSNQ